MTEDTSIITNAHESTAPTASLAKALKHLSSNENFNCPPPDCPEISVSFSPEDQSLENPLEACLGELCAEVKPGVSKAKFQISGKF